MQRQRLIMLTMLSNGENRAIPDFEGVFYFFGGLTEQAEIRKPERTIIRTRNSPVFSFRSWVASFTSLNAVLQEYIVRTRTRHMNGCRDESGVHSARTARW